MRVYFDTEFSDLSKPLPQRQLLSAGLITEYGAEFYAELTDFDLDSCSTFVQDTVLPLFDGSNSLKRLEFLNRVTDWLNALGESSTLICDTDTDAWILRHNIDLERLKHHISFKVHTAQDPYQTETLEDEFWEKPENIGMRHHALFDARCLKYTLEAEVQPSLILFLDFDGVLHPLDVGLKDNTTPVLFSKTPGARLLQHAELLGEILSNHPDIRIVLSTSWIYWLGLEKTKAFLPEALQNRVIGATFERGLETMDWINLPRYYQIMRYIKRYNLKDDGWIAVDDDNYLWNARHQNNLIFCADRELGISSTEVQEELRKRFA